MIDIEQFKKTIEFKQLAKTNDGLSLFSKCYLDILLKGGKVRGLCQLASYGEITPTLMNASMCSEDELVEMERIDLENILCYLFKNIIKNKKWVVKEDRTDYYDKFGKLIDEEIIQSDKKVTISKSIKTRIDTTYFIDNSINIKPLKKK